MLASLRCASLLPLGFFLALCACGSSSSSPSPASGAGGSGGEGGGGGACGATLTCDAFSGATQAGPYTANSDNGLPPPGFPAPPPTATLCGSVTYAVGAKTDGLIYFLHSGSDDELVAYYRTQLVAQGYTVGDVMPAKTPKPCDKTVTAHKAGVTPDVQLYLYGQQGAFSLGPFAK